MGTAVPRRFGAACHYIPNQQEVLALGREGQAGRIGPRMAFYLSVGRRERDFLEGNRLSKYVEKLSSAVREYYGPSLNGREGAAIERTFIAFPQSGERQVLSPRLEERLLSAAKLVGSQVVALYPEQIDNVDATLERHEVRSIRAHGLGLKLAFSVQATAEGRIPGLSTLVGACSDEDCIVVHAEMPGLRARLHWRRAWGPEVLQQIKDVRHENPGKRVRIVLVLPPYLTPLGLTDQEKKDLQRVIQDRVGKLMDARQLSEDEALAKVEREVWQELGPVNSHNRVNGGTAAAAAFLQGATDVVHAITPEAFPRKSRGLRAAARKKPLYDRTIPKVLYHAKDGEWRDCSIADDVDSLMAQCSKSYLRHDDAMREMTATPPRLPARLADLKGSIVL